RSTPRVHPGHARCGAVHRGRCAAAAPGTRHGALTERVRDRGPVRTEVEPSTPGPDAEAATAPRGRQRPPLRHHAGPRGPAGRSRRMSTPTTPAGHVLELHRVNVIHKARTGKLFRPDTVHAVKDVDFAISRGETVGIVGESGCGKSTLARVMVGLQPTTSGEVYFNGEKLRHGGAARRVLGRSVSVIFQDPATALNPRLTIHDALIDPLNVHRIDSPRAREKRVRDLLHLVGLPQSALWVYPSQISGGQRQRVAIARALALEPDIVVADEPTSALDVSVRAQVLNLLTDLKG